MKRIYIICIDDEPEVLEAVERDLTALEDTFPLEVASSAKEARRIIDAIRSRGDEVGLVICDHIMPEETGVDFLLWMERDEIWRRARKVLLTGQAGHEATILAVNEGGLDFYIAKPWTAEQLVTIAKAQMTRFILAREIDPTPYMASLDISMIAEAVRRKGLISDY